MRSTNTASAEHGTRITQTAGGGTRVALDAAEPCLGDACDGRDKAGLRWSMWTQAFGGQGYVNGDNTTGSARADIATSGGATGVDVQLTPELLLGFTAGATSASYTLGAAASSSSARSVVLGLYGGYTVGPAYLDASAGYGRGNFTTQRNVNTGTIAEQINGNFDGDLFGGKVEGGWRFAVDRHTFTPFAGLTVQTLRQNGYTESSRDLGSNAPGVLGLTVQPQTTTSVRSTLGSQISTTLPFDGRTNVRPRLKLGGAHEFNTDRTTNASLSVLAPSQSFTVAGSRQAADPAIVSAGVDFDIGGVVRLFAQFDGDFSDNAQSWSGTGGIRLYW